MIARFFVLLLSLSPSMRKRAWRWWYQTMARRYRGADWTFMNYGFADPTSEPISLEESDEPNRLLIQLYHHTATQCTLEGLKVLEVGCGRGGGASYIARYLKPATVTGMDLCPQAVSLCNELHADVTNLSFQEGDAEAMPYKDESFDVVLNVESSHCYPHMEKFLDEVRRVLRPDGHFLYCDLRLEGSPSKLEKQLAESGLRKIRQTDITPNVVEALDRISDRKEQEIEQNVPWYVRSTFRDFAAIKGTIIYEAFRAGSGNSGCSVGSPPVKLMMSSSSWSSSRCFRINPISSRDSRCAASFLLTV